MYSYYGDVDEKYCIILLEQLRYYSLYNKKK